MGVVGVVSVARAMVAFHRMLRASHNLHDDMIHAVLRAPIRSGPSINREEGGMKKEKGRKGGNE